MSDEHPHRLYTWHWKAALAAELTDQAVLVRTSVGKPRWLSPQIADAIPFVSQLAPYGLMKVEPWAEFERRYIERLEHHGTGAIDWEFERIHEMHGQRPLILLCFEESPDICHRGVFARWWLQETGEAVPEWGAAPAVDKPESSQGSLI